MSKMTSQFFRLSNDDIATNCFKTIADFVATGKTTTVIVDFEDDDETAYTDCQRRLYFVWVQYIANYHGNDKETQHRMLKRQFLAKILCRKNADLIYMFETVKNCEKHMGVTEYNNFALQVASLLSITKTTKEEMSEYLNDIEIFYYSKGVSLPVPSDLSWVKLQ